MDRQGHRISTAVHTGHFGSIAFDDAVIDPHPVESRHDMFDHLDARVAIDQLGTQRRIGAMSGQGRDHRLIDQVHAAEHDSRVRLGR